MSIETIRILHSNGNVAVTETLDSENKQDRPQSTSKDSSSKVSEVAGQTILTPKAAPAESSVAHVIKPSSEGAFIREFESLFSGNHPQALSSLFSGIVEGRSVHTYYVESSPQVARELFDFVQKQPNCFVSHETDLASFQKELKKKPHVVIQEWQQKVSGSLIHRTAMCLARAPWFGTPPKGARKDIYFSGDDIQNPVRCIQGHLFEASHLTAWLKQQKTERCPVGEEHTIVSPGQSKTVHVDKALQKEIKETDRRYESAQGAWRDAFSIIHETGIPPYIRLLEGTIGMASGAAGGALLGMSFLGVPGLVAGGIAGGVVGAVIAGSLCLLSRLIALIKKNSFSSIFWIPEVKERYRKCLMEEFEGGKPNKSTVEASYQALKNVLTYRQDLDATQKEKLLKVLTEEKEEVLSKL